MPDPKETAVPAFLILVVVVVSVMFPGLGVFIGMISPAPLIIFHLQRGPQASLVGIGIVFAVLLIILGPRHAIFFVAEYGVMAWVMAEVIRSRKTLDIVIFAGALASAGMSGLLLILAFSNEGSSPVVFLQEQVKGHLLQSLETLTKLGEDGTGLESLDEQLITELSRKLAWSYPAFIVVGSLFVALANYSAVRVLWYRLKGSSDYFKDRFSRWILPDFFIWVFIFSAGVVWMSPIGSLYALGMNILILTVVIYCLQGVSISFYFLEARSIPIFVWVLLLIFIFTQPLFIGILAGAGLFDLWVDFRKIRSKPVSGLANEDDDEDY